MTIHLLTLDFSVVEKERKKAEKDKKFQEKKKKQESQATATTAAKPKAKEKVAKSHAPSEGYDPKAVEDGRYEWWQSQGFFKPELKSSGDIKDKGSFVIPIPPPNVTGSLVGIVCSPS